MLLAKRSQDFIPTLFNDLFDMDLNGNWNKNFAPAFSTTPQINIIEKENEFDMELSVPGLTKEDLNITIDAESNLVIEMSKKEEKKDEKKDGHYLRHEFSSSQFKEKFFLPDNINKEAVSAKVENGVLNVVLPKQAEEEKAKQSKTIEIQ